MSTVGASAAEMLPQLESARKLALSDAQVYTQVIPGILPIIGPGAPLEVRRWGAEFLAEGFASPLLQTSQKEEMVSDVLPALKTILDNPNEDVMVVKCAIQASASVYALAFSRVISHPDQALLWHDMTSMKMNILERMDSAPPPVRICCIKFLQKVVLVQTPGVITDPRRPERNEVSIALVPRNHPLLPLQNLEAETSGLLDRLLSTLQEQSSDPIIVGATINCLAVLIRTRPPIANKILSAVLNYSPFQHVVPNMTPRQMVIVKSLERTTRALLLHIRRVSQGHPMQQKIEGAVQRLEQQRISLFSEPQSLKRPAEPTDGLDDAKRQRLTQPPRRFPSMPPAPNSFAHLFTLTEDAILQQFDVKLLPPDMVSNIVGLLLQHIESKSLDEAIEGVRQRYTHLQKISRPTLIPDIPLAGPTGIDDEDDYDPERFAASLSNAINDTHVSAATEKALEELAQPVIELGPFELPKPPPLSTTEIAMLSDTTFNGVFDIAKQLEHNSPSQTVRQKSGLNRLAASSNDSQAWITALCRIASRAPSGLDELVEHETKHQDEDSDADDSESEDIQEQSTTDQTMVSEKPTISNRIRHALFTYVLEDWRSRLNVAIGWLTEEWYADKVATSYTNPTSDTTKPQNLPNHTTNPSHDTNALPNYTRTLSRLLTHIIPRFDASDNKLLIRFLSEIPHLSPAILDQIKQLAFDPVTTKLCILALHYLIMFRPPVRNMVLDTLESIARDAGDDGSGVRAEVAKVLKKWRPAALTQSKVEHDAKKSNNVTSAGVGVDVVMNGAQTIDSPASMNTNTNTNVNVNMGNQVSTPVVVASHDPRRRG